MYDGWDFAVLRSPCSERINSLVSPNWIGEINLWIILGVYWSG